jgi:outer membrane murein-binding lipoprotein Lpp
MKTFRLEKSYLAGLATWLGSQQLAARPSRFRSRFLKDLSAEIVQLDEDRIALASEAAEKDENGKAKVEGVDNEEHFVVSEENQRELNLAVTELMKEEYVVDITEGNKEKMDTIRNILLNTAYSFGPRESDTPQEAQMHILEMNNYDVWCNAFEGED